jgi:hypothetical protein
MCGKRSHVVLSFALKTLIPKTGEEEEFSAGLLLLLCLRSGD